VSDTDGPSDTDGLCARLLELAADDRLGRQLRFVVELDRLKGVLRRTLLTDRSRRENSAEHSWHLAMLAVMLVEHAREPVDILRVLKMVLVHDVVEIDAGDTYCYDPAANQGKAEREERAAERLFGLLPADQADELGALWREFELRATPESRFAAALDRLQPLLNNYLTEGTTWREHGVGLEQVVARNAPMADGAPGLWRLAESFLADAVDRGYLPRGPGRA
jgi:putative hydrolase of HD superfamily